MSRDQKLYEAAREMAMRARLPVFTSRRQHTPQQVADVVLAIPREPETEAGKLAVRLIKRNPENPAVSVKLDGLMTRLKDL